MNFENWFYLVNYKTFYYCLKQTVHTNFSLSGFYVANIDYFLKIKIFKICKFCKRGQTAVKQRASSTFTNFLPISHYLYWRRNRVETVQKNEERGKWTFPTLYFRNKFAAINLSRFPNIKLKNLLHVIFYFWHDRKLLRQISM